MQETTFKATTRDVPGILKQMYGEEYVVEDGDYNYVADEIIQENL